MARASRDDILCSSLSNRSVTGFNCMSAGGKLYLTRWESMNFVMRRCVFSVLGCTMRAWRSCLVRTLKYLVYERGGDTQVGDVRWFRSRNRSSQVLEFALGGSELLQLGVHLVDLGRLSLESLKDFNRMGCPLSHLLQPGHDLSSEREHSHGSELKVMQRSQLPRKLDHLTDHTDHVVDIAFQYDGEDPAGEVTGMLLDGLYDLKMSLRWW